MADSTPIDQISRALIVKFRNINPRIFLLMGVFAERLQPGEIGTRGPGQLRSSGIVLIQWSTANKACFLVQGAQVTHRRAESALGSRHFSALPRATRLTLS